MMQLVAKLIPVFSFFGLSTPLTTTFTCLVAMVGTNNRQTFMDQMQASTAQLNLYDHNDVHKQTKKVEDAHQSVCLYFSTFAR